MAAGAAPTAAARRPGRGAPPQTRPRRGSGSGGTKRPSPAAPAMTRRPRGGASGMTPRMMLRRRAGGDLSALSLRFGPEHFLPTCIWTLKHTGVWGVELILQLSAPSVPCRHDSPDASPPRRRPPPADAGDASPPRKPWQGSPSPVPTFLCAVHAEAPWSAKQHARHSCRHTAPTSRSASPEVHCLGRHAGRLQRRRMPTCCRRGPAGTTVPPPGLMRPRPGGGLLAALLLPGQAPTRRPPERVRRRSRFLPFSVTSRLAARAALSPVDCSAS